MSTDQDIQRILKNYTNGFHAVVPFDPAMDKLLALDFTDNNKELSDEILADTTLFSKWVNQKLQGVQARYGIGGYNEHRTIYKRSEVFSGDEPRRLHLGTDLWAEAGTPVYAPLEATVHSFGFNDAFGDYGATLILQHELDGVIFHTLYGHLSLGSIENKREGQSVEKGEWIASFGEAAENGHWPPHLHFQLIIDMKGMKGDFPGVCPFSQRVAFLANSPDPDLILGMSQYL